MERLSRRPRNLFSCTRLGPLRQAESLPRWRLPRPGSWRRSPRTAAP